MTLFWKRAGLVFLLLGMTLSLVLSLRLGVVVASVPRDLWLVESPALVQPGRAEDAGLKIRAEQAAQLVDDPFLTVARLPGCAVPTGARPDVTACLTVIDEALATAPLSGELWLARARMLLQSGDRGPSFRQALSNAYAAGPREGWLAAQRALLGLQIFSVLPKSLQDQVVADLELVIASDTLSPTLVSAYLRNPLFSQNLLAVLDRLPLPTQRRFLAAVEART